MYYIYHIEGIKIGCTSNIKSRLKKYKSEGIFQFDIIETHTDIYKASEREMKLQKEYGYPVDHVPYYHSKKMQEKGRVIGGIAGGNAAVQSGQLDAARKKAFEKSNHSKYRCPHCGTEGQYRAMKRWHDDNCKHKK
jgi:ribosomal protein L37AE/L43A